uniref:Uncharacterized protein n=1 Tax=Trichogramma kaykai TaxID=54128 RepID=A0ABD2XKL5_9HYME
MEYSGSRLRITSGGYFVLHAVAAVEEHNTMMKQRTTTTTSFEKSAAVSCLHCWHCAECPQCLRRATIYMHDAMIIFDAPLRAQTSQDIKFILFFSSLSETVAAAAASTQLHEAVKTHKAPSGAAARRRGRALESK